MDRNVGYWLQQAARQHRARMAQAVQDLGLFPGQEQVMMVLFEGKAQSVSEIAEVLNVRQPTVSKTLQRLAAQNFIQRTEHGVDARKSTVLLTSEGVRCATALVDRMAAMEDELTGILKRKQGKRLRKLLRQVARAMAAAEVTPMPEPEPADPAPAPAGP